MRDLDRHISDYDLFSFVERTVTASAFGLVLLVLEAHLTLSCQIRAPSTLVINTRRHLSLFSTMAQSVPITGDVDLTDIRLQSLLGLHPTSTALSTPIRALASHATNASSSPEVKAYSDAVYFNYHSLGISLLFKPVGGYKPKTGQRRDELQEDSLELDGIDIYHSPKGGTGKVSYTTIPVNPIALELASIPGRTRPATIQVTPETTGKDFVACLGEPDRKGGGAGPSSGSIGIWCEWTKDGIMVEFGGDESRGPQAWERGKDATWKVITLFRPPIS
ncbi:hypothetical protein NLI96_g1341 [Meripilus lineatus]|uniref:Uncharacterized protein n=1 Tax=Meripilus lineatus TaxID=2056292 RepID=A0AAD5VAS1_9APHY|nr:hypothetical protein NLI96_g1341 [Physisporinus lineatus]